MIQHLKSNPNISRAQLTIKLLEDRAGRNASSAADLERAINLAVRIMTMVNCSAQRQCSGLLEHGAFQIPWRSDIPFSQFINDAFPMTDHPSLNEDDHKFAMDMRRALMAKKIKKHIGVKFQRTDDLRRHLKLDRRKNVLEIFHHTAFLKEHLRLTKDEPRDLSTADSLKM